MLKKILKNTFSQIISKVWTAIISIILLSVLTNYLSIELFWLYSKVYNYLWIFAFLADLGLYTIAVREISKNSEDSSKIIWNIMTLRLILWILILFLSLWIAYFLPWYNSNLALISIFIVWIFTIFSLLNC
jgi:O-antigen/teichoic acid export membrane protein